MSTIRKCLSIIVCFGAALCTGANVTAQEVVLSDFNNSGFDYTFQGFDFQTGATSTRLYDMTDGWGGAGVIDSFDLSTFSGGRMAVDMFVNAANGVDRFELELLDANGNTGKWPIAVSSLAPGVPQTLVTPTTLDSPIGGVGDWQNLDLSQITSWQILGEFGSPQNFDINFDRLVVANGLPDPPPYPGFEADAPWRAVADSRIETHRKADIQVTVTDAAGIPIPGAAVGVAMREHEFGFGSAVQSFRLDPSDSSNAIYRQTVSELFNYATLENSLKWPPWEGEWGPAFSQQVTATALNYLDSQDIGVRGHALVWPGYTNLPEPVQDLLDNGNLNAAQQQQLRDLIAAHIDDIAGTHAGQLDVWDVVNEPRSNHDIMDVLAEGDLSMVEWFQRARANDPDARLFLNDFGIITSGGGTNTSNQQTHYDFAQFLKDNGAPIDGVGFQGHFTEGDLTGPEQLWTIFDNFADLDLDLQITEFDFTTTDEELQAAYTYDILKAAFAHEAMDEFLLWGFWEDAHWRPDAALFNSDWSIKPNGQAFIDLIYDEWWTDESTLTSLTGEALVRAFKGSHDVTVSYNGFTSSVTLTLSDGGEQFQVTVPFLVGDFDSVDGFTCNDVDALVSAIASGSNDLLFDVNFDGTVNHADLDWWLARAADHNGLGSAYLVGDANLDGVVDGLDFIEWNDSKFTSHAAWCSGDFNADGVVDGLDFILWNDNKFQSSGTIAVPEPMGSWLLFCAGLALFGRRKRCSEALRAGP